MKITPILYVEAIEPCLEFWVDKLGMKKTVEVPEGDRLGFVMFEKDGAELMMQTHESAAKDAPEMKHEAGSSIIFVEIEDFEALRKQVEGLPVLMAVRDTFYGMREIGVREPGGNAVCFAARIVS